MTYINTKTQNTEIYKANNSVCYKNNRMPVPYVYWIVTICIT